MTALNIDFSHRKWLSRRLGLVLGIVFLDIKCPIKYQISHT